jgi:hypothetical protein
MWSGLQRIPNRFDIYERSSIDVYGKRRSVNVALEAAPWRLGRLARDEAAHVSGLPPWVYTGGCRMILLTCIQAANMLGIGVHSIDALVRYAKLKAAEGTSMTTWRFTPEAVQTRIAQRDRNIQKRGSYMWRTA